MRHRAVTDHPLPKRIVEIENQAFRRGNWLLALQFHAEMGEGPGIEEWIAGNRDYLAGALVDPAALRMDYDRFGPTAVRAGQTMIAEWLAAL